MNKSQDNENKAIIDLLDYLYWSGGIDLMLFRGQSKDWDLLPKIARFQISENFPSVEKKLFDHFKRESIPFLSSIPDNDWDWLAIAQHYGLPTRLLDWTKNPLAALWFVVREIKDNDEPGVLWIYTPDPKDIISDTSSATSPFSQQSTKVFQPKHITSRIRVQEGMFTVHLYQKEKNYFSPFQKITKQKPKLKKMTIPASSFDILRFTLDKCGIHDSSLFPDLDGLSRRIAYTHLHEYS